MKYLITWKCN